MFSMPSNEFRTAMISVTISDIVYLAEAPPETPHTFKNWTVSRIETVSPTVTVVQVKKALQIPGANGAGLAAIWGD